MTLLERAREALAEPSTNTQLVLRLHALIGHAMGSGVSGDEISAVFERLRSMSPLHEDVLLDALEFLEGRSSPHLTLRGRP